MKEKLTAKESVLLSSMLFGLFFGAGNLIFPIILGAKAGASVWPALVGMLITAVGIPLLGIISMGISRSEGLADMSSRVSKGYSYFFTCALYLTIGPLFAIPRCAATSFTVGVAPLFPSVEVTLIQAVFTAVFFGAVLLFSLRPSNIMNYVGKWLNPIFLVFLCALTVTALFKPVNTIASVPAQGDYADNAFTAGFLQGYDTLDALASLAFGIIVINVIRGYGVKEPNHIAKSTVKSGVFSMGFMALIYAMIALVGTRSYGIYAERLATDSDFTGGDAFAEIALHYFGKVGLVILALTVTFCCLKTAIGLVTSCSETFAEMFPKGPKYKTYAVIFTLFSFVISNIGLSSIIQFSAPVLYFLYPLAIVLILLSLFGKFFGHAKSVYVSTVCFTMIAAIADLLRVSGVEAVGGLVTKIGEYLPLYSIGLGWILPAAVGFVLGWVIKLCKKN